MFDSVEQVLERLGKEQYIADKKIATVVFLADKLEKPVLVEGPAGTGKTYISQRLCRLFRHPTLIPHAIAIDDTVVQVFDPLIHRTMRHAPTREELKFDEGHDPRFIICERPVVITGGELTSSMLEVHFEPAARLYEAPLQLKANNGMFIIDDMGRQRVSPAEVSLSCMRTIARPCAGLSAWDRPYPVSYRARSMLMPAGIPRLRCESFIRMMTLTAIIMVSCARCWLSWRKRLSSWIRVRIICSS